uniref:Ciliary microtubule associated protein 1C n=1 Tax=Terrapene triunguis TaxID=2587831 RepID=A0A674K2H4_9SAUR
MRVGAFLPVSGLGAGDTMWQGPGAVYSISRGAGGRCSLGLETGRRGNQGAAPCPPSRPLACGPGAMEPLAPCTPAPNEYHTEKVHPQGEPYAPAYSLGDRTRYRENDPNPAPNAYTLPGMLGPGLPIKPSAPCYSMASKMDMWSNAEELARVPGPASFVVPEPNVYLHRQPAYSMWRKYKFVRDSTPGPADYKTGRVTITKPRAPDFSLGIRHSEYLTPLVIDN